MDSSSLLPSPKETVHVQIPCFVVGHASKPQNLIPFLVCLLLGPESYLAGQSTQGRPLEVCCVFEGLQRKAVRSMLCPWPGCGCFSLPWRSIASPPLKPSLIPGTTRPTPTFIKGLKFLRAKRVQWSGYKSSCHMSKLNMDDITDSPWNLGVLDLQSRCKRSIWLCEIFIIVSGTENWKEKKLEKKKADE